MDETIRISIEGIDDAEARRAATGRTREAGILELYRLGKITSGRASEELGLARADFLDLAARHRIPSIQITPEELAEEIGSFKR